MKRQALIFILFVIAESLVIYRRKPKPKLICREEQDWSSVGSGEFVAIPTGNVDAGFVISNETILERVKRNVGLNNSSEPIIFLGVSFFKL